MPHYKGEMSNYQSILKDWEKKIFKPVYWFEGKEGYFIDKLVNYAENHILPAAEASFNLTVFYGKDAVWSDVVNACMKYPMFSDRQVVILKEAQEMKDIDLLSHYIEKPLASTVFIIAYKNKAVDAKTQFAKFLKAHTELIRFDEIKEYQLPKYVLEIIKEKGLSINQNGLMMLIEHIGSDLSRISNELDKLMVNMEGKKQITEDLIEEFIGISKEFNAFELQKALGKRDLARAIQIVQYFEANPKSGNMHSLAPILYAYFSRLLAVKLAHPSNISEEAGIANYQLKDYQDTANRYSVEQLEKIILLLHKYNLRSLGVNEAGSAQGSLMKEMVMKIAMC